MQSHQPWFWGLAAVLAVWRLAHLIAHEDGPFDLVVRLRRRAGDGAWGRLMDCPYCLSLWLAAPTATWLAWRLDEDVASALMLWLALSGGACVIERLPPPVQGFGGPQPAPPVPPMPLVPGSSPAPDLHAGRPAPHDERTMP